MLKMLDLFSGIGGFSLAASWTGGIETVAFCEIEPYCQKVLHKHWPDVPIYPDIKQLRGEDIGSVDIVCGGFPCQPFSCAGKQRGKEDDRYLWPEMFRVIQETKPTWVIGENVANFVNMGLDDCFSDLEGQGYEVQPFIIPACGVNAPHRRDRIWIIAYNAQNANGSRIGGRDNGNKTELRWALQTKRPSLCDTKNDWDTKSTRQQGGSNRPWEMQYGRASAGCNWIEAATALCGMDDGLSSRVDKIERLKALGNAIVPQVVYPILQGIVDIERQLREG